MKKLMEMMLFMIIIYDHHVDHEFNNIKEIFYHGLYVRNYEHQKVLDISLRNAIHKNYKINKNINYINKIFMMF